MLPADESQSRSVTDTSSTLSSEEDTPAQRRVRGFAIVLEAERVEAGPEIYSLEGVRKIELRRGKERRAEKVGHSLVVEIPDQRMSKPHAEIDLEGAATLRDLNSSNGTFIGDSSGEQTVKSLLLSNQQAFRVGHTFAMLIDDAGPLLARAASPWPFTTLSSRFAIALSQLQRVAASKLPLLLLGDTGTGKEVLARAVHVCSERPGPFIAVNCGALPPNLVEAQLFGHQKGAFSGAVRDELGFVRAAHNGTLFLDEIGDLPQTSQASLLRVLQEGEVTPVGASQPSKVDVRIVSATHAKLADRARDQGFRADLYARLAGFAFVVPPLRERRCDLGAILATIRREGAKPFTLRPDAVWTLLAHDFPMNVRELRHAIESATILSAQGVIASSHFPETLRMGRAGNVESSEAALRAELERRLREHGGNLTRVARDMGKARQQIQRWVRRFGIKT